MKYIVAMDSFKGSLSSEEAGNAVAGNIRKRDNEADIQIFSMSDGGDGLRRNMASPATAQLS